MSTAFLIRARESLLGAESEFANGLYNNAANRAYYACFQAAIAALVLAGIRPPGSKDEWGHEFVQSQFNGVLIGRRKRYGSDLRDAIEHTRSLRQQGDYKDEPVSQARAKRSLDRAKQFVAAVEQTGGAS